MQLHHTATGTPRVSEGVSSGKGFIQPVAYITLSLHLGNKREITYCMLESRWFETTLK